MSDKGSESYGKNPISMPTGLIAAYGASQKRDD
jgi:hypothetical protein